MNLRILFVSSHARDGGAESYLEQLLERLRPCVSASVVCLEAGPLVTRLHETVPVRVIPVGRRAGHVMWGARRLRAHLSQVRPDVIHANGTKAALLAALATVAKKIPVVWVKHDFSFDGWLVDFIAARAASIVGVSHAVVRRIPSVARKKVRVIPNAIDAVDIERPRGREMLRAAMRIRKTDRVVGIVGRLHPIKGHMDLFRAVAPLCASYEDVHIAVVGGPDLSVSGYDADLQKIVDRLGMRDRVHFLGHRSDARLLMAGFDVGVVCSRHPQGRPAEGFPLTVLEMLSVGIPVVAYAEGGIPEAGGEWAALVPPGDVTGLSREIAKWLKSPEADGSLRRGRMAHARARTVDDVADEMIHVYMSVANR